MAIVPVNKITLYGIADEKEAVLDGLQRLGCAHVVNLSPGTGEGRPERGYSIEAHEALQYLRECPVQRQEARDREDFDFVAVEREALEIRRRQQELSDERELLAGAIDATAPWGEFHLPAEDNRGGLRFWFYVVPHYRMEAIRELDLVWQTVARDERFEYVVVVHPNEPQDMPVAPQDLDPRSLSQLERRMEEVDLELAKLHWRRVELTRWCREMKQAMAEADDQALLEHAARQTLDVSRVFAVRGWAPRAAVPRIEEFAQHWGLALSVEEPGPDDDPPTLLDNPELVAGGQSAVTFYMTPGYRAWDPSIVMFFSFAVFFAMILSDAGYSLILGVILALAWRSLGRSRTNIRLRNLLVALVLASVGYGVMVGSYFGMSPADGSGLAALKMLDVNDWAGMMRLSIVIGVFHLILANLITAWRYRRSLRFLAPLGWVAMILGGLIAGFKWGGGNPWGLVLPLDVILLSGGAGAVLLFSSERPFSFSMGSLGLRLLDGIMNLTGVSKAFGDVLSYLRLFALGLASSQLAMTFNEIAETIAKSHGLGILAAILILAIGHSLNFALAVMGGVVHGLRLNCIEFFNWSLTEEGYPFQAFEKKASL